MRFAQIFLISILLLFTSSSFSQDEPQGQGGDEQRQQEGEGQQSGQGEHQEGDQPQQEGEGEHHEGEQEQGQQEEERRQEEGRRAEERRQERRNREATPPPPPPGPSRPISAKEQRYLELSGARKDAEVLAQIDREIALHFINRATLQEDAYFERWVKLRENRCDLERERCINPMAWAKITCRFGFEGNALRQREMLKLWKSAVQRAQNPAEMTKIWGHLKSCSARPTRSQGIIVLDVYTQIDGKPGSSKLSTEMKKWWAKNVKPSVAADQTSPELGWWQGQFAEARNRKPVSMRSFETLVDISNFLRSKMKPASLNDNQAYSWIYNTIVLMDDLGRARAIAETVEAYDSVYLTRILKAGHLGLVWKYCRSVLFLNEGRKCPAFINQYYNGKHDEILDRMKIFADLNTGNFKGAAEKNRKMLSAQRSPSRDIFLQDAYIQYYMGNYDESLKALAEIAAMYKAERQAVDQANAILSSAVLKIKILARQGKLKEAEEELKELRRLVSEAVTGPFWGFAAIEFEGVLIALYEKDRTGLGKAVQSLKEVSQTPDGRHYYIPVVKLIERKLKGGDLGADMKAVDAARGAFYPHTTDLKAALKSFGG